jgi:hypothetical protein
MCSRQGARGLPASPSTSRQQVGATSRRLSHVILVQRREKCNEIRPGRWRLVQYKTDREKRGAGVEPQLRCVRYVPPWDAWRLIRVRTKAYMLVHTAVLALVLHL